MMCRRNVANESTVILNTHYLESRPTQEKKHWRLACIY